MRVCVSTGMCPAKSAEPIEMPFGRLILMNPRNHVLDGGRDPHGKGQFCRLSGPLKSIGTFCCGVCSKRIIYSSITAMQCHPTAMLPTGRCHITLSPWKFSPLRCGLSTKFFHHLFKEPNTFSKKRLAFVRPARGDHSYHWQIFPGCSSRTSQVK